MQGLGIVLYYTPKKLEDNIEIMYYDRTNVEYIGSAVYKTFSLIGIHPIVVRYKISKNKAIVMPLMMDGTVRVKIL